jgi:hypothetical protein
MQLSIQLLACLLKLLRLCLSFCGLRRGPTGKGRSWFLLGSTTRATLKHELIELPHEIFVELVHTIVERYLFFGRLLDRVLGYRGYLIEGHSKRGLLIFCLVIGACWKILLRVGFKSGLHC